MNVEINMINVEDGDAIILMLRHKTRKALIVIDGGYKTYYGKLKRRLEEILPIFDNKIDLLICTHYDNDHIGGTENILDDYHSVIQEIWIHKIENTLEDEISLFAEKIEILEQKFLLDQHGKIKSNNKLIIEGYKELLRVVKKIKDYGLEDKIKQATRDTFLKKFPEFSVVAPTNKYYNQNLAALKKETIQEELLPNIKNKSKGFPTLVELYDEALMEIKDSNINNCEKLETSSLNNSVTATNMVSIVTLLKIGSKKFLFTGDAGIESFEEHTPKWEEELKDLFFLDIPHHGSKNNTSKKMLEIFNPKYVFVSGKASVNRPSKHIENCLISKPQLKLFEVTNKEHNTWYLKIDQDGTYQRILI